MAKFLGYSSGHPWYYFLGGRALYPKEILAEVKAGSYRGFITDIDRAARLAEPKRSETLRKLKAQFVEELKQDIARYRECVLELHRYRLSEEDEELPSSSAEIHTSVSLKHNHILNDFAHLLRIEELLSVQRDLFA